MSDEVVGVKTFRFDRVSALGDPLVNLRPVQIHTFKEPELPPRPPTTQPPLSSSWSSSKWTKALSSFLAPLISSTEPTLYQHKLQSSIESNLHQNSVIAVAAEDPPSSLDAPFPPSLPTPITTVNNNTNSNNNTNNNSNQWLPPNEAFKFNVTCSPSVSEETCSHVKIGFQNAGIRLASILHVKKPIMVQAHFKPFCTKTKTTAPPISSVSSSVNVGNPSPDGSRGGTSLAVPHPPSLTTTVAIPKSTLPTSSIKNINLQQSESSLSSNSSRRLSHGKLDRRQNLESSMNKGIRNNVLAPNDGICEQLGTLGRASPASFFSARPVNEHGEDNPKLSSKWLLYPQALIKQLKKDIKLSYHPIDIIAEFNSDYNFFFASTGSSIGSKQTDFEFVVTHELSHGLGFDTSLVNWPSIVSVRQLSILTTTNLVTTYFKFEQGAEDSSQIFIPYWQPLSVYDSFLVETRTGTSLMDFVEPIFKFHPSNRSLNTFLSDFEKSKGAFKAAQTLFDTLTHSTNSFSFKPSSYVFDSIPGSLRHSGINSNKSFGLETDFKYEQGSTLCHLEYDTLYNTPDFLMIPAIGALRGRSLDTLIKNVNGSGVYGPAIMMAMMSMGWETEYGAGVSSVQINADPLAVDRDNAASGKGYFHIYLMAIIIIFLFKLI